MSQEEDQALACAQESQEKEDQLFIILDDKAWQFLKRYQYLDDRPDVYQELCIKTRKRLGKRLADFPTFCRLMSFLRNYYWRGVIRDFLNKQSRYRCSMPFDPDCLAGDVPDPLDSLCRAEFCATVQRALDRLPPRQKRVLELQYVQEMDRESIATQMGLTVSAVGSLLNRAKQHLQADRQLLLLKRTG